MTGSREDGDGAGTLGPRLTGQNAPRGGCLGRRRIIVSPIMPATTTRRAARSMKVLASHLHCPTIAARRALRRASALTCALIVAGGGLAAAPSHAAPARVGITVHGTVFSTNGGAVPFATVSMEDTSVTANSAGQYSLDLPSSGDTLVHTWVPGYRVAIYNLHLPTGADSVGWNFSGEFARQGAFGDPPTSGKLSGLPVSIPASSPVVHFHGSTNAPLEHAFVVELPDGHVKRYKLTVNNAAFSGVLPLSTPGAFRVEINNIAGLGVFNVLVFHVVKPALPQDLPFPADPPGGAGRVLANVVLNLLNSTRLGLNLPNLVMQPNVLKAAESHTENVIHGGYMFTHPHIGSDGSTVQQRLARTGFRSTHVGEDIAIAPNMRVAVLALLTSPIHLANIIGNFQFAGIGVGRSGSAYIITIDLAR